MSSILTTRGRWELTGEAFAKFLACLGAEPERAGERYEAVRLALVKFFDWQGALTPEDLADEVINRVARKIDEGDELRDVPTYCHGVARLVLLEHRKAVINRRAEVEEIDSFAAPPETAETIGADERRDHLERCLGEMPVESRQLVLRYYQDERRQKIDVRAALARQLGIPLNALRSRVQRIRDRLEQCIKRRLAKKNHG
jgi:RNA polymerase sigma factor (sigma-70 family)